MNWKLPVTIVALLALGGAGAYYLSESSHDHAAEAGAHDEHGHGEHAEEGEGPKGPHGGRLLKDGDFSLELAIFEKGVPPEFRAWFAQSGKPVAPREVKLSVELKRPWGDVDTFSFTPEDGYARGNGEVEEPHSFDYTIVAEYAGRTHRWQFAAPEMQTTIGADAAKRAGVAVEPAGPATMTETLGVYGQVKLNADKIALAVPRFSGAVREARKALGDPVAAGEVLAVVEANQSLVPFEVKAPISGVIVDRAVTSGGTASEGQALYTIADLSTVWVELNVPKRDQSRVKVGQSVSLHPDDGGPDVTGKIAWLSPFGSVEGQTFTARVVVPNPDGRWRPGLFIKADITLGEQTVPVAVKESGLQTLFDFTVVFSQHGDLYQARPLELGRRGGGYVEVLKGLKAGERYVTENSFLIKADIGKSGASHDH